MLVFKSIQGLAPIYVHHKYEINERNIFFIYPVNGAYLMNISRNVLNIQQNLNFAIITEPRIRVNQCIECSN